MTRVASSKRTAQLFHALSDETRLAIIRRLSRGERCVCDLTDLLETGQSRLSWHLKVLKDAGLVNDRKAGRWMYYSLDPVAFGEAAETLEEMLAAAEKSEKSQCCA